MRTIELRYVKDKVKPYGWMSNSAPASVFLMGNGYPTVDHAFQAAKTFSKADRLSIRKQSLPGYAVAVGQDLELREDWATVKESIMLDLLRQKYSWSLHPRLAKRLIDTGDAKILYALGEGGLAQHFWGVNEHTLEGENKIGLLLMQVRQETAASQALYEGYLSTTVYTALGDIPDYATQTEEA